MTAALVRPIQHWYCPACGRTAVTSEARPHTEFHPCPRLRGLNTPMVPAGTAAKVELVEREDYVGRELVQRDPERRRPVMAIRTTRDDGQDVAVFAPTATARA